MDVVRNRQICLNLLCINVMHLTIQQRFTGETEGVGFEPTVGCPTLDFESSALNRTQPPFRRPS
jgi:hypothetical protein